MITINGASVGWTKTNGSIYGLTAFTVDSGAQTASYVCW